MSTDLSTIPQNEIAAMRAELPSHLQDVAPDESVGEYALLPKLLVVMGTSDPKFKDPFDIGDVIIPDTMTRVAESGKPLIFTPVFIYSQYEIRNPREAVDLPATRAITLDKTSDIARKALQRVEEPCPNNDGGIDKATGKPRNMRYQHTMLSIWYLHEFEMLVLTQFYRMELQTGQRLATLVQQRKKKMYACVFQARTSNRPYKGNNWPGFDFSNPSGISPWVQDEKLYEQLRTIAEEQSAKYVQAVESGREVDSDSTESNSEVEKQFA